jgi:hypothetical protein
MAATVRSADDPRWLEVDREVSWADECGDDSSWVHGLDRYTGAERNPIGEGRFVFNFWAGAQSTEGATIRPFTLAGGRVVLGVCSGPQTMENDEGGGWITIFDGEVCHDPGSGLLLSMFYTKRWLFTGTFEGQTYERAYFGDNETYEFTLRETNLELTPQE